MKKTVKERLFWFTHDVVVAVVWVRIFAAYYFCKGREWLAELWRGNDERR
jgi:hypothetical protein